MLRTGASSSSVLVPEDSAEVLALEDIGVDHPSEERLVEVAANGIASGLRGDGTLGAEYRTTTLSLHPARCLSPLRQTPIDVLVPLGNGERHPLVQLIEPGTFWHGIHRTDEHH